MPSVNPSAGESKGRMASFFANTFSWQPGFQSLSLLCLAVIVTGAMAGGAWAWDIYEDQAVYLQIAAGMWKGMAPYIDPMGDTNFPGIMFFHAPFVFLFGPGSLFSFHLQDIVLTAASVLAGARILNALKAGAFQCSVFAACFTASHFLMGPTLTAQREVLGVALVAFASVPWIGNSVRLRDYFLSGFLFAAACWVKPVFILAGIVTVPLLYEFKWQRYFACFLGSLSTCLLFVGALMAMGCLDEFYDWCFRITLFGNYGAAKQPLALFWKCLLFNAMLPSVVILMGIYRYLKQSGPNDFRRLFLLLILGVFALLSVFLQHKYLSVNHWIFYIWTCCLTAGLVAPKSANAREGTLVGLGISLCLGLVLCFHFASKNLFAGASFGRVMAEQMPELKKLRYSALTPFSSFSLFLENPNHMPGGVSNYLTLRYFMSDAQRAEALKKAMDQVGKIDVYLRFYSFDEESDSLFFKELEPAYLRAGYSYDEITYQGRLVGRAYSKTPGLIRNLHD